jgi:YHS domain-containing protein
MAALVIDPVCKMEVDPDTAPARTEYRGETYYFCAAGCKHAFDESPQKYLNPAPSGELGAMPVGQAAAIESKRRWWEFWKG